MAGTVFNDEYIKAMHRERERWIAAQIRVQRLTGGRRKRRRAKPGRGQ